MIVTSRGLPPGWTGKLWAVKQGIDAAMALPQPPDYLLLTDADIVHDADSVRRLAAHAQADGLVLTSLMVKLRCESFAERVSIPAFIFFFQMLYPFSWVNRPGSAVGGGGRRLHAGAGGCAQRRPAGSRRIRDGADRRLRLGEGAQGAGPDLARIDRSRAQHPALSGICRHSPHGGALGLCATALFAAAARRNGRRHGC